MNIFQYLRNLYYGKPNNNILEFTKVRDVKTPNRGTKLSSGIDFYVPNDFEDIILGPNKSALIPSGIHVNLDPEWTLIAFNKSGIASKKSLLIGAQVIDADYQGEVHINVHNVGSTPQVIKAGDKLVQFILLKVSLTEPVEISDLDALYETTTERGADGFGSTGN